MMTASDVEIKRRNDASINAVDDSTVGRMQVDQD